MPAEDKTRERGQTDESLRVEREKADADLGEKQAAIDEAADTIIEKARARADEVLAEARARADGQRRSTSAPPAVVIEDERAREDRAVQDERAFADAALREERAELAPLRSTERDKTDQHLSTFSATP